jgi:CheY-like chemotaxis protein
MHQDNRPLILVVEDSPDDMRRICSIVEDFGLPIRVSSTKEAMEELCNTGKFDAIVLDLMLGGATAAGTVGAFMTAAPRLPVIVVTGYDDDSVKRECQARGWSWVSKESKNFQRALRRALDNAIDREDSTGSLIQRDNSSQLDAILAETRALRSTQKEMQFQLDSLVGVLAAVMDQLFGPVVDARTGRRDSESGCVAAHKQARKVIASGTSLVWIAIASVAGSFGAVMSWILGRLTQ